MLETQSLILREPKDNDDYFLHQLNRDEEVMKYIGPTKNREESRKYFERAQEITTSEFGYRIAVEKQSAEFIGWFVLKYLDQTNEVELGYRLIRKHWGKGYATEGARRMVEFAFKKLKLERIVAVTMPENKASHRVLEKLGFIFITEAEYYGKKLSYYELRKAQFFI